MKEPRSHIIFKQILFAFLVLILVVPLTQHVFSWANVRTLDGHFEENPKPQYSSQHWLDGQYQRQAEAFLNTNFGFRNSLVRGYNQFYFDVAKHTQVGDVVVGKEDYLFGLSYINATLGRDFVGEEKIARLTRKLKDIQDTLATLNKTILVVLAPGKATFYEEFIPDKFNPKQKSKTNYEAFRDAFAKNNIRTLDLSRWFLQAKDTAMYPLFPKTGIHWSSYGDFLAMDTILKTISKIQPLPIAQLKLNGFVTEDKILNRDDDIEKSMNLLYNISDLRMGYPFIERVAPVGENAPRVLTIADSYFWEMMNFGITKDFFGNGEFWYYNKEIYPRKENQTNLVADINLIEAIESNDVIMLLFTDANLKDFAYGFIENVHEAYFGEKE